MNIDKLGVPPFNTTLLGVVRGVADYYGLDHSDAMLYGATSHAFLINIHEALCPSGPYCWKPDSFRSLLGNLGIEMIDHGFFSSESPGAERERIEALLREHLDRGVPCSLLNMENQLITGYDEAGFITTQPWAPHVDFPPAHLTFGTWEELGEEIHMSFFTFRQVDAADTREAVVASLRCGADMCRHPEQYTDEPYGVGPRAYEKWIAAAGEHGDSHGNWWNGTVWAECRRQAASYLREIGETFAEVGEEAQKLAQAYDAIAANLERSSDKELESDTKIGLLGEARAAEEECAAGLERLAESLGR